MTLRDDEPPRYWRHHHEILDIVYPTPPPPRSSSFSSSSSLSLSDDVDQEIDEIHRAVDFIESNSSSPSSLSSSSLSSSSLSSPSSSLDELDRLSLSSSPFHSFSFNNSYTPFYIASALSLAGLGMYYGLSYGDRQAQQLELDNPVPRQTARPRRTKAEVEPAITPAQRRAAARGAMGALGLGTALCGAIGVVIVYGLSYRYQVDNVAQFTEKMKTTVSNASQKWISPFVSHYFLS